MSTLSTQPQPSMEPWMDRLPTLHAADVKIQDYIARHLNPWSPRRRWATQRAALNSWFYWGRQWIEPVGELVPTAGAYAFRELYRSGLGVFKRPITNLVASAVDNEVARLGKKELIPDAQATKNKPEWIQAAKLAQDIAKFEMGKLLWGEKRSHIEMNLCLEGTAIARAVWDESQHDSVFLANPDAMHCPACQAKFASAVIPRGYVSIGMPTGEGNVEMRHKDSVAPFEEEGEASAMHPQGMPRVRMQHCPFCEEPSLLKPYEVSEEEAYEGGDVFHRSLGIRVPRGEGNIEVLSVHEYYPENTGIGIEPYQAKIHHQMTVRPMEQILARFPELAGKIQPEEPSMLLRLNPMFNEPIFWQFAGGGQSDGYSATVETYERHARVREVVMEPMPGIPGLERGAWFVQVNDQVLRQPLCVEVQSPDGPKLVPRVKYATARFKRIPHYFYGRTFVDDIVPIQRRLNETDAQWVDLRERGVPTVYVPHNTEMYTKDESEGSLRVVVVDSPNPAWTPQNSIFPGIPLTGNAYAQERANCFSDAQMVGAAQDVELGIGEGGPKTTSGLMLLSEQAAMRRGPRERDLSAMYETLWQQFMDVTWAFRKEQAILEIGTEGSTVIQKKAYTGHDLLGGIRVKVGMRSGFDISLYNKEATGEALQVGLVDPSNPATKRKVLQLMQIPEDLAEGDGVQINRAEMAWSDFKNEGEVVAYDESLFDPIVWHEVLGKRWMEDDAYQRQREVGFDEIIERLSGWQEVFQVMSVQDEQQKQLYGNYPKEQWPVIYERQSQIDMATSEAAGLAAQEAGQPQPLPPPPTAPPPDDGFLPANLARRIYTVWKRMLPALKAADQASGVAEEVGVETPEMKRLAEIDLMLQMRAVIEAAKMLAEQRMGMTAEPQGPEAPQEGGVQ